MSSAPDLPRLSNTSYVVLGLVEVCEPATPYDLKQFAEISVFNFWTVPHTQVYAECSRLAEAGLLDERKEESGRRRKVYRMTKLGSETLDAWRGQPSFERVELRDVGLIKLFFGGDPAELASSQIEGHRTMLELYEQLHAHAADMPEAMRLALECGIGCEREFVRFWTELAEGAAD